MRNLDRFLGVMRYDDFDHPPLLSEGPWADTLARWHAEGLAGDMSWQQYFGVKTFGITNHGFNHGLCPPFEEKVIEETDEHVISINAGGVKVRNLRHVTSMPHSVSSDISWDNFRYYMETLMALHVRCANRA